MFQIDPAKNLVAGRSSGYSVCKKHLEELLESSPKESNTFLCKLWQSEVSVYFSSLFSMSIHNEFISKKLI